MRSQKRPLDGGGNSAGGSGGGSSGGSMGSGGSSGHLGSSPGLPVSSPPATHSRFYGPNGGAMYPPPNPSDPYGLVSFFSINRTEGKRFREAK